jgi:hypothetical protein
MGGRGEEGIDAAAFRRRTLFARFTRVHVGPAQRDGKNAESSRNDRSDDDLRWHHVLLCCGSMMRENQMSILILIKFGPTICRLRHQRRLPQARL